MGQSCTLRARDVRAIYELAGECRDLGDDAAVWRRHWFGRLAALTGTALVIGGEVSWTSGGPLRSLSMVEWGWENGFDRNPLLQVMAQHQNDSKSDMTFSPLLAAYFRRPEAGGGAGLCRTDLVTDAEWHRSPYFRLLHAPAGFGHSLVSFARLPGCADAYSGVTVTRLPAARRDFGPRDRELIRAAHLTVAPLVGGALAGSTDPAPSGLAPRVRQVLRLLLEGEGDKQIAKALGISPHTVNQYVKVIFEHFRVGSRAELLARCLRRGWSSRAAWAETSDSPR